VKRGGWALYKQAVNILEISSCYEFLAPFGRREGNRAETIEPSHEALCCFEQVQSEEEEKRH
jgi:hypothetical protein